MNTNLNHRCEKRIYFPDANAVVYLNDVSEYTCYSNSFFRSQSNFRFTSIQMSLGIAVFFLKTIQPIDRSPNQNFTFVLLSVIIFISKHIELCVEIRSIHLKSFRASAAPAPAFASMTPSEDSPSGGRAPPPAPPPPWGPRQPPCHIRSGLLRSR